MIKGHSGSGARNPDVNAPGPILMLSETSGPGMDRSANSSNGGSSPSSPQSPPSTTTTSSHHYPHIVTSDIRNAPSTRNGDLYSPLSPETDYHSPGMLHHRIDPQLS